MRRDLDAVLTAELVAKRIDSAYMVDKACLCR